MLRIDDEEKKVCHKVYSLGYLIRYAPPHMVADRTGRVHLLYLSAPGEYLHHIFSPLGLHLSKKRYFGQAGQVALTRVKGGGVKVVGGTEEPEASETMPGPAPFSG